MLHHRAQGPVLTPYGPAGKPDRCGRCCAGGVAGVRLHRPEARDPDPGRDRRRNRRRCHRRVPGADDPDAAAGRPVQRRGRWRGGDRGSGRAHLARSGSPRLRSRRHRLHHRHRLGELCRVDRHLLEAPGADDDEAGDLPRLSDRLRRRPARRARLQRRTGPDPLPGRRGAARRRRRRPRRPAGAAGGRCGRPDRHLPAQRVHRADGGRERLSAGEHPAAGGRHPGGFGGHPAHPDDGERDGPLPAQHAVRCAQGRFDTGRRRDQQPTRQVAPPRPMSPSCWPTPSG